MLCNAIKRFKSDYWNECATFKCLLEEGHLTWHTDRRLVDWNIRWEVTWVGDERVKCSVCNQLFDDLVFLQNDNGDAKELCEECANKFLKENVGWW